MPTYIVFQSPDPAADVAFSVVDAATGNSFSPSKAAFAAAPPDEMIKSLRDPSPHRPEWRYAQLPVTLVPPTPDQYLIFAHPAAGGPSLGAPFPVVHAPAVAATNAYAVTF